MNIVDKLISFVNPTAAVRREMSRMALRQIESYEAATKGRRTNHWRRTHNDADADIMPSITMLRSTSRNMVRNNSFAFRAIENITNNTVGSGIRPDLKGPERELTLVKKYWKAWAEKAECDFNSQLSFYGLTSLGGRSMFESGACLLVRRRLSSKSGAVLPIKLQLIESDYIDLNKTSTVAGLSKGDYIRHGIQYNQDGQRTGYWLFKKHPGNNYDFYGDSYFHPEEDVVHLYRTMRPGQDHGVPTGVSAFLGLNDFDDYRNAELMAKKLQACFAVFLSGSPTDLPGANPKDGEEQKEKLAPGLIYRMRPGETATFAEPAQATGIGEYARVNLLQASAGYGTTYEGMTGDLSNVNFSSIRIGNIEVGKINTDIQLNTFVPKWCDRVFAWFLEALSLVETIDTSLIQYAWTLPRKEMTDMDKETKALGNQLAFGLNSWSEIAREGGNIPEDLAQQMADDIEMFKKLGLPLFWLEKPTPNPPVDENGDPVETQPKPAAAKKGVKPAPGKNPAKKTPVNKS